jgi:hypothetical protein
MLVNQAAKISEKQRKHYQTCPKFYSASHFAFFHLFIMGLIMKSSQVISQMDDLLKTLISCRKKAEEEGVLVEDVDHPKMLESRIALIRDFGDLFLLNVKM